MSAAIVPPAPPQIRWTRAPRVSSRGFLYDEHAGVGFIAVGNSPAPSTGLTFTRQRTLMGALTEIAKYAEPYRPGTAALEAAATRDDRGAGEMALEIDSLRRALGEPAVGHKACR